MYDRFTDSARKVIQLANAEAIRRNRDYIASDDVLFGLVEEAEGVAGYVLKSLDIDGSAIRKSVDETTITRPASSREAESSAPAVKSLIEASMTEAGRLNHRYVGTEHLLLAIVANAESDAARVLTHLGVVLDELRREVLSILGHDLAS